jgi:RNA polymerase sigma-70 factor (ECF subfamily)
MEYRAGARPSEAAWPGGWPQSREEFAAFVDLFLDRLVGVATNRLRDRDEAEDVVQEVLLKAYVNRGKLRHVQQVGPYLFRMLINACIARVRRGRNTISLEELGANDRRQACGDAQEALLRAQEIQHVEELLSKLPVAQATVLRLRILDEFSLVEIAQITRCNLATTKSRLSYGLKKLRQIVNATEESL